LDITIRPDAVIFSAKGDLGTAEDRLPKECLMVYKIEADEEASARYSRSYLEKIVGSARELSDAVTIELSPNMPLRLTFSILGGKLQYLIAPRVE
jgi:DNA polymerase III sliding clamp (beta) subunit (PCNA family)